MTDRKLDWLNPERIILPTITRRGLIVSAGTLPFFIGRDAVAQSLPEVRKPKDPREQPPLEFKDQTGLGDRFVRYDLTRQSGELAISFREKLVDEISGRMISEQTDRAGVLDDFNQPDINFRIRTLVVSQRFEHLGTLFQVRLGVGTPEKTFGVAGTRPIPEADMGQVKHLFAIWGRGYLSDVILLDHNLQNSGINTTIYNAETPKNELLP